MHKTVTAHATERSSLPSRVLAFPTDTEFGPTLPACLETSLTARAMQRASAAAGATVVLIDQDNCRASAGWPPARAFRERLNRFYALDPRHANTAVVIAVDERRHSACPRPEEDGVAENRRHSVGRRVSLLGDGCVEDLYSSCLRQRRRDGPFHVFR